MITGKLFEGEIMSNSSPMSMQELEMESAELLPGRETLCVTTFHPHGGAAFDGGFGDTAQGGLVNVAALNGSFDGSFNNILNGNDILNGLHVGHIL
jgi:hypothetical protein